MLLWGGYMSLKKVGRPKKLDRQNVIDVAFNEYWLHGIHEVSVTKIAQLSKTSRPGIYVEFGSEDKLKAEVLRKYIKESVYPVYESYNNYKRFPNQLMNNYNAIIYDGNEFVTDNKNYLKIKRPKKSIGCMMVRSILNINKLGPLASKEIKELNKYRKKMIKTYILNAQNDEVFYKNFDIDFFINFILEQFKLVQLMRLEGSSKTYIKQVLNASLDPFYKKKEFLN